MGGQEETSARFSKRDGVYPQKQDGLYMQRIRIPGGRICAGRWRRLAELSAAYCGGTPLHVTTRQDVELHNVPAGCLAAVHAGLSEVSLRTRNTGGDSLRNITLCPGCDLKEGAADLLPVIKALYSFLVALPVCEHLPRKFKISFSACEKRCALPFLNDLGFVLRGDGRFVVFGAGSLGPRPNVGIELADDLRVEELIPFAIAVLEVFNEHGDRSNRRKARLRHVRERMGDEAFRALLQGRFEEKMKTGGYPEISIQWNETTVPHVQHLRLPTGDLETEEAVALAELIETYGLEARLNMTHGIELYGNGVVELGKLQGLASKGPSIVCCPGADTCPNGLVHTRRLARRLRENLGETFDGACIRISGCANHCTHTAAAEIGLSGCRKTVDGEARESYRVFVGGGEGKSNQLGSPGPIVLEEEVLPFLISRRPSTARQ